MWMMQQRSTAPLVHTDTHPHPHNYPHRVVPGDARLAASRARTPTRLLRWSLFWVPGDGGDWGMGAQHGMSSHSAPGRRGRRCSSPFRFLPHHAPARSVGSPSTVRFLHAPKNGAVAMGTRLCGPYLIALLSDVMYDELLPRRPCPQWPLPSSPSCSGWNIRT